MILNTYENSEIKFLMQLQLVKPGSQKQMIVNINFKNYSFEFITTESAASHTTESHLQCT